MASAKVLDCLTAIGLVTLLILASLVLFGLRWQLRQQRQEERMQHVEEYPEEIQFDLHITELNEELEKNMKDLNEEQQQEAQVNEIVRLAQKDREEYNRTFEVYSR